MIHVHSRRLQTTLLFIPALFTTLHALVCQQEGAFTVCEIPHNLPPAPLEHGVPIDFNSYSPSQLLSNETLHNQRQSTSAFAATIERSPSTAHTDAINFSMQRASDNWISNITVSVKVTFSNFGASNILGSAQPSRSWVVNRFICPVALAESVMNREMNAHLSGDAQYDIIMTLNADANWYLGTDARPPRGQYDLVTVCLHETYHGLFLSGGNIGLSYNPVNLTYSAFFILEEFTGRFDAFMANQDGCNITAYNERPLDLGRVLTGNNLWFAVDETRIARLHAPTPFAAGSSLYHLSETVYGSAGDMNGLMTPAIGTAYSQHNAGDIVLKMQQMVQDVANRNGSLACDPVTEPLKDDGSVEQMPGDGSDSSTTNLGAGSGFVITIGGAQISGWIIVGAAIGFVSIVVVVGIVVHRVIGQRRKGGGVVRDGENGGGIV